MSIDKIINETQINIMIDTNIPGEKPFSFTKNILYSKLLKKTGGFSEYPYFSSSIAYPKEKIMEMGYPEQVAFFFKKDTFLNILKETPEYKKLNEDMEKKNKETKELLKKRTNKKLSHSEIDKELIEKLESNINETERKKNTKNNIMFMLFIIFPTNYPIMNNLSTSYDRMILGNPELYSGSLAGIIPFIVSILMGNKTDKQKYSYIKTPSKGICTVSQIIWLNDIYNNPEYKETIKKYEEFQEWKIIELYKKEKELQKKIKKFNKKYSNGLNQFNDLLIKIKNPKEYFRQTYVYNVEYLKEYENLKEIIPIIQTLNRETITKLISFRHSFTNLKNRLSLEEIHKDFDYDEILEKINEIEMLNEIINYYLGDKIRIRTKKIKKRRSNIDKESEELENRIKTTWKEYNKYSEFINFIQQFTYPNNESSNKQLQKLITSFINGEDNENNFEKILTKNIEDIENIDTGITINNSKPIKNTIYVRIDVIGGEISDDNKSSIKCIFSGENLGNELKNLLNPTEKGVELDSKRFYFDLNTGKSSIKDENDDIKGKENEKKQENEKKEENEKKKENPKSRKYNYDDDDDYIYGGKKNTRKMKMKKNNKTLKK